MGKNTIQNLAKASNGSMVSAFLPTTKPFYANQNFDVHSLSSLNKSDVEDVMLGLIRSTEVYENRPMSLIGKAFENKNFIYAQAGAKIKWQEPVGIEYNSALEIISDGDYVGVDGTTFEIRTKFPYVVNDIFARANPWNMDTEPQFLVHDVYESGADSGFIHVVSITPESNVHSISKAFFETGSEIMWVEFALGEFSTNLSGLSTFNRPTFLEKSMVVAEPTGVEASISADGMLLGIDQETKQQIFSDPYYKLEEKYDKEFMLGLGMSWDKDVMAKDMATGKTVKGGFVMDDKSRTPKVLAASFIEWWVWKEAIKKGNVRMMYSRGFTGKSQSNHRVAAGQGAWIQIKNGAKRMEYSSLERFGIKDLANLSELCYQGTSVPTDDRVLELSCGRYIFARIQDIIKDYVATANTWMTPLGDLPQNPIKATGTPYEWEFITPRYTKANIPGVGEIRITHDPAIDSMGGGDPYKAGIDGLGNTKNAYSIIVWSRNKVVSEGLRKAKQSLAENVRDVTGQDYSNIHIIRKVDVQGNPIPVLSYGMEQGRVYGTNVQSVTKERSNTHWAIFDGQALVLNPSDIILCELA
jgi:hypothetical protein